MSCKTFERGKYIKNMQSWDEVTDSLSAIEGFDIYWLTVYIYIKIIVL